MTFFFLNGAGITIWIHSVEPHVNNFIMVAHTTLIVTNPMYLSQPDDEFD